MEYRASQQGQGFSHAEDLEEIEQQVEDKIQIAIAKGELDNLDGKGVPLRRLESSDDNPFLDRGDRIGFDLLQKHGFAPEWIEQQKGIRRRHRESRRSLAAAWLACGEEPSMRWLAHKDAFREELAALNRAVRDYNLICPASSQLPLFDLAGEVRAVRQGAREVLGDLAPGTSPAPASEEGGARPPQLPVGGPSSPRRDAARRRRDEAAPTETRGAPCGLCPLVSPPARPLARSERRSKKSARSAKSFCSCSVFVR
ncbi:unnamed protein product [Prorocentrum cordatum]|uniref:DnaJ homologue subfamily C member 28 conserved domain-containing protein n=1 Tax=Prorocentrum cordatum TaxID=2364126 RepID=A0ABN9SEN1_9DINO|nr:unnamed protein product [Polarella glacialis]